MYTYIYIYLYKVVDIVRTPPIRIVITEYPRVGLMTTEHYNIVIRSLSFIVYLDASEEASLRVYDKKRIKKKKRIFNYEYTLVSRAPVYIGTYYTQ